MTLKVVLYAEGEVGSGFGMPPAPGESIEYLSATHILVGRCIEHARGVPFAAIKFHTPLRDRRGRILRGSMLLDRRSLREALFWPLPTRRPDLAVVLVDRDGDVGRRTTLGGHIAGIVAPPIVIGVSIEELESWLLADRAAVLALLAHATMPASPIASLSPGAAKQLLRGWCTSSTMNEHDVRESLARSIDLPAASSVSVSLNNFLRDLV